MGKGRGMKQILLSCCIAAAVVLCGKEFKSGSTAMVHKIDKEHQTISVYAAKSSGPDKKVCTLHWSSKTLFLKLHTVDFSSLKPGQIVWLYLAPQEAKKVKQGKYFICSRMNIEAERHSRLGFRSAGKLCAPVYPQGTSRGEIEYAGKRIPFKAPEKVTVSMPVLPDDIKANMYLQIWGSSSEKRFNISHIVIQPPKKTFIPVRP